MKICLVLVLAIVAAAAAAPAEVEAKISLNVEQLLQELTGLAKTNVSEAIEVCVKFCTQNAGLLSFICNSGCDGIVKILGK